MTLVPTPEPASARPWPANQPLRPARFLSWIAVGGACYAIFLGLSAAPQLADVLFAAHIAPGIGQVLSLASGVVGMSLLELGATALLLFVVFRSARALRDAVRRRRQWSNVLAAFALQLGGAIGIAVASFYLLWGFNYAATPLAQRLGLPAADSVSAEEIAGLTAQLVDATNATYLQLHGQEDARQITDFPDDRATLAEALREGWTRAARDVGLNQRVAGRYGAPKTFVFSSLFSCLGINGMYSPFTGEALLVAGLPALGYPSSAAHEQAHQRGVASESEAVFVAYLVTTHAPDVLVRYSGYASAVQRVAALLARLDTASWRAAYRERLLPGARRDIDDYRRFAASCSFRPGVRVRSRVQDAFLKSNRVKEGLASYSLSVQLLVRYARSRGGVLTQRPGE
jgi:hypothetical protein